jgi:hypothetical protein
MGIYICKGCSRPKSILTACGNKLKDDPSTPPHINAKLIRLMSANYRACRLAHAIWHPPSTVFFCNLSKFLISKLKCIFRRILSATRLTMIFAIILRVFFCSTYYYSKLRYFYHRLNIELDLQSLFGLLCTAVLIG